MKPSRGVVYMAISALGFSVMGVLVKVAATRIPTGEIVLARALVTLALSYVMLRRARLSPWGSGAPGVRSSLIVRGVLGFAGLAGFYLALAHLPIADAVTLQNTIPILTSVLAWWMLGEAVGRAASVALAFGTIGVLLVVRPTGEGLAHEPLGVIAALAGAACSALAYVTVRKLSRTEHSLVIVFVFPLVATPLAIPWAAIDFVVPSGADLVLLLAIGIATQVGQVFLTMGLAAERVASAASVNYLQVVFAMLWQVVVFDSTPSPLTIVGAGVIIAGTAVTAAATDARRRRAASRSPGTG